ncbi:MAG TPA: thioesterase family protein [Nakamurella sp.]|nr:thioesterase family protein [Nakamurella sp.]
MTTPVRQDGPVHAPSTEQRPRGTRYVTEVRVRWSDLDAFGHVNNARTVTLLEEARVDWLFVEAARHGVDRLTEGIVVSRLAIDYRRAIGFGLPVTVSMGISALAAASFTIDYQVLVGGELAASASTVLVPVNAATFRPRRMDPAERAFLSRYLIG